MFYVIHYAADSRYTSAPMFEWYEIRGTRQTAMQTARELADRLELQVKYLSSKSSKSLYDFDAGKYMVVQQTEHFSHGA